MKAFVRFLQSENADLDYVKGCIQRDDSGQCIVSVMDKFAMHISFDKGRGGKPLDGHSCMQYSRRTSIGCQISSRSSVLCSNHG